MGLETVVNIADLVKTNPGGADPKSQGDDHIRNLKNALLNDLGGFAGAIMTTGADGGAVNAYTLTPANALPAYSAKMTAVFAPTVTNTGACTINISGLGAKNILSVSGAALVAGDLVLGSIYSAFYDGVQFRLLSITKNYADQLAFSAALPAKALGLLASPDGLTVAFTKSIAFGLNEARGADVASSATPDIWSGNGNTMHITGVAGITGFSAAPQAGAWRELYFEGACLLTNSANFNIQGGVNYTTAAGDVVFVYADTTTKFYLFIQKASGLPVVLPTPPALVLLAVLTPTVAAAIDFLSIFSATYDNYLITGVGITLTNASTDQLNFRFANAGVVDTATNFMPGSTTSVLASGNVLGVAPGGKGLSFDFLVSNANDAVNIKTAIGRYAEQTGASAYDSAQNFYSYIKASAVSGFRLYWGGGSNFVATGKIRVYGFQNS